jgi:hypothetical protein
MRMYSRHSSVTSISTASGDGDGKVPVVPITLEFMLRGGGSQELKIFGMLDTGASITIIPAYQIGLSVTRNDSLSSASRADNSLLAGKMDFQSVALTGVLGGGRVPGYSAYANVGGIRLPQPIIVGAVSNQWIPLIGRDILDAFLITLDPWERRSFFSQHTSGRLISMFLSALKGNCIRP